MLTGTDDLELDGATQDDPGGEVQPEADNDEPFYSQAELRALMREEAAQAVRPILDQHYRGTQSLVDRLAADNAALRSDLAQLREDANTPREEQRLLSKFLRSNFSDEEIAAEKAEMEREKEMAELRRDAARSKQQAQTRQQTQAPAGTMDAAEWEDYFWGDVYLTVAKVAEREGIEKAEFDSKVAGLLPKNVPSMDKAGGRAWRDAALKIVTDYAEKKANPPKPKQQLVRDRPAVAPAADRTGKANLDKYVKSLREKGIG